MAAKLEEVQIKEKEILGALTAAKQALKEA
jgi:hypothetical protein